MLGRIAKHSTLLALALLALISGCAWDYPVGGGVGLSVHVKLPKADPAREVLSIFAAPERRERPEGTLNVDPTTLPIAAFNCFAVNVIGEGIPNLRGEENVRWKYRQAAYNGSHCAYTGATSNLISLSSAGSAIAEVFVPPGKDRVIQVLGIVATSCPNVNFAELLKNPTQYGLQNVVELGRRTTDIFKETSTSIDLTSYSATGAFRDLGACDNYSTLIMAEPGLTAYWRMNPNLGVTSPAIVANLLGTLGHMQFTSGAEPVVSGALSSTVSTDKALETGTGANGLVATSLTLNQSGFTVEMWVKRTANCTNIAIQNILFEYAAGIDSNYIKIRCTFDGTNNNLTAEVKATSGPTGVITSAYVLDSNWHHIALVFDSSNSAKENRLFVDGGEVAFANETALSGPLVLAGGNFGKNINTGSFANFNGYLDEVAIYNTVLSDTQILRHAQVGVGTADP